MPTFKCSYCDYKTSPIVETIVKHYDIWHPDKKVFPCETCGKLFSRKHDLERHMKESHSETEKNPYNVHIVNIRQIENLT